MSTLKLWTRSFHSQSNFGFGGLFFHGDGRQPSISEGVTSRIRHYVTADLQSAAMVGFQIESDPSSHPIGMGYVLTQDYSDPKKKPRSTQTVICTPYRKDGDQQCNIPVSYSGQNFAMPFADTDAGFSVWKHVVPDLDLTNQVNMRIDRTKNKIHITCGLTGDGFPDAESFLIDSSGTAVFLASHIRIASAAGQLPGGRAIALGSTSIVVDWTPADVFGDVVECRICIDYSVNGDPEDLKAKLSSNPCSVSEWNALHTGRDMMGGGFFSKKGIERRLFDQLPGAHRFGVPGDQMPTEVP